MAVQIDYLADHLEAIPILAESHHAAWSSIQRAAAVQI
jgi:hypothetical protein